MDKHEKILKHLALIAEDVAPIRSSRLAACLVYKHQIISYGICQYKTHPFQKEYCKNNAAIFLHAENACISSALNRWRDPQMISKSTLYVSRVKHEHNKHKEYVCTMARPCDGCQKAIAAFNISKVYFTTDEGYDIL